METVRVETLQVDDIVLIRPGASVPADGMVVDGESGVNKAMITGESRSVRKQVGDEVIAGTFNGVGSLRVRVTATGDDATLPGIMRLVEEVEISKSETQVLTNKAAGLLFYAAVRALLMSLCTVIVTLNAQTLRRAKISEI